MASKPILSNEGDVLFIAIQTGPGVINKPLSSGTVYLTAAPTITQKPRNADNKEMRRTRDSQPGTVVGMSIGEFKFSTNLVLSGSKGVVSCIHPLLLSTYGRHTITTNEKVTYTHYLYDDDYVYLTVLAKKDSETQILLDCVVDSLTLKSTAATLQVVEFSGYFLKKFNAGTGFLNAAITGTPPATAIVMKTKAETETFEPGAYITVGSDDNTGQGFLITAVNVDTKTLTIQGGVTTAQPANAIVTGWAPVDVASGYAIDGGFGEFIVDPNSEGPAAVQIISADYTLKNSIAKIEDERTSTTGGYTGRYGKGKREVTFNTDEYLTIDGLPAEYHLKKNSSITVELNMGDEDGKKAQIIIPNMRLTDVTQSGDAQKKQTKQGKCYPDEGDDPSSLILC